MTRTFLWCAGGSLAVLASGCAVDPLHVNEGTGGGARGGSSATQSGGSFVNAGGSVYTACTGKYEEIQSGGKGLCVAKMARIAGPIAMPAPLAKATPTAGAPSTPTAGAPSIPTAGAPSIPTAGASANPYDFSIDVTEVTRGQYEAWVATNPDLPASDDVHCSWKLEPKAKKYAADAKCITSASWRACKQGCEHHPQVCVDWCDAYAYCAAVNKRLCGRIGGGPTPDDDYDVEDVSQWYRACSAAGANRYPYADVFDSNVCRGRDYPLEVSTVEVGSLSGCVTATGVYDLSGNVREWEDCCDADDGCRMRGGSFGGAMDNLRCTYAIADSRENEGLGSNRALAVGYVGFRCCSR